MVQKKPSTSQKAISAQKRGTGSAGALRSASRASRQAASHAGREDTGGRLAWLIGGGLALVVALLVGIGYYNDSIGPARDTAIVVGGHKISLGYYRDRLKASVLDSDPNAAQVDAFNKESSVTDILVDEQVYLQRAPTLGVTVSDDDIALAMAKAVRAPVKDNQISDVATYETLLRNQLQRLGLSLGQFRTSARAVALRDKVVQHFKAEVPKQALVVKAMQLIFSSEQQGRAAQERLGNGDTVNDIAADSVGNPSMGRAVPLDWTPVPFGIIGGGLDDVLAKLNPGEVSDLIKVDPTTKTGTTQWYLLALIDRDPNREVTDTQTSIIAGKMRDTWLDEQKSELGIHSLVDGDRARWAATHSGLPERAKASPTPARPAGAPGTRPGAAPPGAPGAAPPVAPPPSGAPSGPQPGAPPAGPAPGGAVPAGPPAPGTNPPVPNGTP